MLPAHVGLKNDQIVNFKCDALKREQTWHQSEPHRVVNMHHHALRRECLTPSTVFSTCYAAGAANSASTGILVVDSIVPGSFAEGLLEPGDVMTHVQGKVVTHFLALEDTLDSSVGATVELNVERGGQPLQATIKVSLPVLACHCALGVRLIMMINSLSSS